MDGVVTFIAAMAGGLVAAGLFILAHIWWEAHTAQWPRELHVHGAKITVFRDGLVVFRRANGSWWAEQLCHRDREFQHAAAIHPADPKRELH